MIDEPSTKPYLIRAIHEWCADQGLTPYLAVKVDATTRVPREFVKDGEIVLELHQTARRNQAGASQGLGPARPARRE